MNESLIKYLSGLLDADGSLSFNFRRDPAGKDHCFMALRLTLVASDEVDHDRFVESLPALTGMGRTDRYGKNNQFCQWSVHKRADLEMLLPRLIKHMVIKAQHWQWLLDTWRDQRSEKRSNDGSRCLSMKDVELLKEAAKHSRRIRVGPLKPKNYPTWAWVAGYLDGDGWYTRRAIRGGQGVSMRVSVVAHENDRVGLDFLQHAFGGSITWHTQDSCLVWYRNLGAKDADFALRFLPNVAKHARLKRHKIDMMIHTHRQRLSDSGAAAQATV